MAFSQTEGNRILRLQEQRERDRKDREEEKRKIKEENRIGADGIKGKFSQTTVMMAAEERFKNATVGLVTADEFKKKRKLAIEEAMEGLVDSSSSLADPSTQRKKKKAKKSKPALVSFDLEEEDGDGESMSMKKGKEKGTKVKKEEEGSKEETKVFGKFGKDPTVDTTFLPDRDREEQERIERDRLRQQWLEEQERVKNEIIEVTYSYWDGSGHRRSIEVRKGTTIDKFLEMVRKEFRQLRGVSVEDLLYIKEDIIIPQHYSFYDLIVTKARGKSGPLFHFDVHDDIRMVADARKEKDESHAGKVVERSWYEKNKHIFPASRWEVYDPTVLRDKYTVHDHLKKN